MASMNAKELGAPFATPADAPFAILADARKFQHAIQLAQQKRCLPAVTRGRLAAQQVHSLREPTSKTAALWSDTRLQQTFCNSEGRTPVCYPAGLAPAAVGPKAAEPPPVESGICGKRARTAMHRVSCLPSLKDLPGCKGCWPQTHIHS